MKRHREKEWSNEEFDAWLAATDKHEAVAAAADEEGGPRLSLVTTADRAPPAPTDLLAPDLPAPTDAGSPADTAPANPAPVAAEPLDGVALTDSRRRAGWSAERQRRFLAALAETGSVHLASAAARLSARSAYQLRARSTAFATEFARPVGSIMPPA